MFNIISFLFIIYFKRYYFYKYFYFFIIFNDIKNSHTINTLEKKDIELNHYINSTELRLPSCFIDLSYDNPENK